MTLPSSWLLLPLSDVCVINPRASHGLNDADLVSFLPMKSVDDVSGAITKLEDKLLSDVKKGYTSFQEGDVLFAKITPCMENGKAAIARNLTNHVGYGSTEFHVLRPKKILSAEYLHYFIRQASFRLWAKNSFMGSGGQQRVPIQFFKYAKIPVPPFEEQQEIVHILRQTEQLRLLRQDSLTKVQKLASAIFLDVFGNYINKQSIKDASVLGEYIEQAQYGSSESLIEDGNTPVLRMNAITYEGWLNLDDLMYAKSDENYKSILLESGDLIFNRTNSIDLVGKTAVWRDAPENYSFASYLIRVKLKSGLHPEYVWGYLNSIYGKKILFNAAKQAVSMANISATDLKRIKIPVPPDALQEKYFKQIQELRALRASLINQRTPISQLFQQVSWFAFSGKLTEKWRETYKVSDVHNNLARHINASADVTVLSERKSLYQIQSKRESIYDQLSTFQKTVWDHIIKSDIESETPEQAYITADLPRLIADLPDEITTDDQVRLGTTLATLTSLGLIAKVSLPDDNGNYVTAYRAIREQDELSPLQRQVH